MLPARPRTDRLLSIGLPLAIAACAALPPSGYPAHVDYAFEARFTVDDSGALLLPASRRDLVVRSLEVTPRPRAERFSARGRSMTFLPGTVVRARGDLRAYRRDDGSMPSLAELLPGAALLR